MSSTPPPPDAVNAARTSRSSNGYLLLGFVLTFLPSPYRLIAILPLLLSVIGAARTSLALRRMHAPRPVQTSNLIGLAMTVTLMAILAVPAVLSIGSDRQACLDEANTRTARQACVDAYGDGGVWDALFD